MGLEIDIEIQKWRQRRFYELINQLAVYRPDIYFGGAEPFIREDLLTIFAHVKRLALAISFTTMGILLNQKNIQKVAQLEVDAY